MICKLTPALKQYLWGGRRLAADFHKNYTGDGLGESWELSCHPDGESILANGPGAGQTLSAWLAAHPDDAGTACRQFGEFPVLIKLIDAAKELSVQVHPGDAYARAHEGQLGKTEMWYVVDAKPGAQLIYGPRRTVTREQLRSAIADNTLLGLLRSVPVRAGDVFYIESGTIHAIGAGILVAEIQQSSNVTYRLYDYGRLDRDGKPRTLHVEDGCAVSTLTPARAPDFGTHLARCRYFTVDKFAARPGCPFGDTADAVSFRSLLILSGAGTVCCGDVRFDVRKGDTVFAAAGSGAYRVEGDCAGLLTYVEADVQA